VPAATISAPAGKGNVLDVQTFRNAFGYNDFVLRRKPTRAQRQDLRDVPTYTIPEAAGFLAIPRRTLFNWFEKEAILKPSAMYGQIALLSFHDVAEAYVLEILRSVYTIGPRKLADIVRRARLETKFKRPLIQSDLGMLFGKVIMVKPARGKLPRRDIDLVGYPNLTFPGLLDLAGTRLLRDKNNIPYRLHPWRLMKDDQSRPVTVDPKIMSGRAVVTGTRIPITLIAGMARRGKTPEEIADNFNIKLDTVNKVLRHIEKPLQKVA
jgi:uncharacterized protein (DUF433 family)